MDQRTRNKMNSQSEKSAQSLKRGDGVKDNRGQDRSSRSDRGKPGNGGKRDHGGNGTNRDRLSDSEIKLILRGADSVIASAGRSMLAKILKGSKDKRLLEHMQDMELHHNPAYGSLSEFTLAQITDKIDWMIRRGYLKIEYDWKMPVIVFTEKGWEIEREERAKEFLREWDEWIYNDVSVVNMAYLKGRNRGLITLFLDKIMATNDPKYLPLLRKWEPIDYKKVRAMIRRVIQHLESCRR